MREAIIDKLSRHLASPPATVCRFSVKWKEAFSVSVNSALRAGIFKAFGSFDPMWFWEERGR